MCMKNTWKITVDEFVFLKDYKGILVHDHFTMYFGYGIDNAECNVQLVSLEVKRVQIIM